LQEPGRVLGEVVHAHGDNIKHLPLGPFYDGRRLALERIDLRSLPFVHDRPGTLCGAIAKIVFDLSAPFLHDSLELRVHLGNTQAFGIIKLGDVIALQVCRKIEMPNMETGVDLRKGKPFGVT
jgi:hypothetical protein